MKKKYSHVRFEERCVIERLLGVAMGIRQIAEVLDRSPNTIAAEIRRNRVDGRYTAGKANHKAYAVRWRAKKDCLKVAMDAFLTRFVIEKLEQKWSPRQMSAVLKRDYGVICSSKAIYRFAESRCLEHLLFWGWNKRKGGPKQNRHGLPKDGRAYINERSEVSGAGHLEMDFIVSKHSAYVLLVIVDRLTKRTWVRKVPNRKRATIRRALSLTLQDVVVRSITTDNDIAFTCWRELEELLQTRIYFTHPYHSWEKGLVENTNRWVRCFVPKRRDIASVTEEEMREMHAFLNDRPRECLGFVSAGEYYSSITVCPA